MITVGPLLVLLLLAAVTLFVLGALGDTRWMRRLGAMWMATLLTVALFLPTTMLVWALVVFLFTPSAAAYYATAVVPAATAIYLGLRTHRSLRHALTT